MGSPHPAVTHPRDILRTEKRAAARLNDQLLTWLTDHVLASVLMFDCALILPLAAVPMSSGVKITLALFSGSWIQWWALPALQRSQNKADAKRDAKADADHAALTHIASAADRAEAAQERLAAEIAALAGAIASHAHPGAAPPAPEEEAT